MKNTFLAILFSLTQFAYLCGENPTYVYLEFDPSCMQKLDYEVSGPHQRLESTFRLPVDDSRSMFFTVGKREEKPLFPQGTIACGSNTTVIEQLQAINEGLVKIFIIEKVGNQEYYFYPVSETALLTAEVDQLNYEGKSMAFSYGYLPTPGTNDLSKPGSLSSIYYRKQESTVCPKKISFVQKTTIDLGQKKLEKEVNFILSDQFGIIEKTQFLPFPFLGQEVTFLKFINGQPLRPFMEAWCYRNPKGGQDLQAPQPTVENNSKNEPESKNFFFDASSGYFLDTYTWEPANIQEGESIILEGKKYPLSAFQGSARAGALAQLGWTNDKVCRLYKNTETGLFLSAYDGQPFSGTCEGIQYRQGKRIARVPEASSATATCLLTLNSDGYYVDVQTRIPFTGICEGFEYRNGIISGKKEPNTSSGKPTAENGDCTKLGRPGFHVVQSGESLGMVARKYGLSLAQLKEWNNLTDDHIYPCTELLINNKIIQAKQPEKEGLMEEPTSKQTSKESLDNFYTVQAGDNLIDIAQKSGVSVDALCQLNQISPKQPLLAGTLLRLPDEINQEFKAQPGDVGNAPMPQADSIDLNPIIFSETKTPTEQATEQFDSLPDKPTITHDTYVVKPGDTLWKIAQSLNVQVEELIRWNQLSGTTIKVNQKLHYQKKP